MTALQLNNLSLHFGDKALFTSLNLHVAHGQWVAILGRSGCGKSTLLKAIAALNHGAMQQGDIQRNTSIAYMAQHDALLPWLNAAHNVQLAHRLQDTTSAHTVAQAHEMLDKVGLLAHAHKPPFHLSGGQRQRVALARTLMQSAKLVLMDEPFSAVDAITRIELQQLASTLLADKAVVFITHDPQEAICLADVIYVMHNGGLGAAYYPKHTRPRLDPAQVQPVLQQQLLEALACN